MQNPKGKKKKLSNKKSETSSESQTELGNIINYEFKLDTINASRRFSKEQLKEFKLVFDKFDVNGDGCVTMDEIITILGKLDIKIDKRKIKELLKKIDIDNNESIEWDEFLGLMSVFYNDTMNEIELKEAFDLFDLDSDSFITYEDLKEFLILNNSYNDENEEFIKDMIKFTDINKDTRIDLTEFSIMYQMTKDTLKQLKEIGIYRNERVKSIKEMTFDFY